ncbi:IS66 family transposase zinc-finger binding domain-containing protein [Klebsiella pneumoniae]
MDDPAVQRTLRQTRTRKPFPESLPAMKNACVAAGSCCPECGGALSYLGEDAAEQLRLMRSAFQVIRTVREKHACTKCDAIVQAPRLRAPLKRGIAGPGADGPRADLKVYRAHYRCIVSLKYTVARAWN